jgi:hypothetical protein
MRGLVIVVAILVAVLVAVGAGGCSAKLSGNLTVDGEAFKPTACRSGEALGFSGIELSDAGGRRLRLAAGADGRPTAVLFASSQNTGDVIGVCGSLEMKAQSSRINGIMNVMGTAQLACAGDGHEIGGNLTFENCH